MFDTYLQLQNGASEKNTPNRRSDPVEAEMSRAHQQSRAMSVPEGYIRNVDRNEHEIELRILSASPVRFQD